MENKEARPNIDINCPAYLDPNHEYYSAELAIAIEVWQKLYESGTIRANRAGKKQIKDLLEGRGLSNEAINRISTLVNPNKKGGAPVTSP